MRVVLFANTDWFLFNFKLALAQALRARGDEVVLLSPPGEYGPRLQALGFQWVVLPVSRSGVNPLQEWATLRRITALYKRFQPDVVHHFTIKCVIYGALAAKRAGVQRVVNSITGLGFALLGNTLKAHLIRPVVLALYRRALAGTAVVFQNTDNQKVLTDAGVLHASRVFCVAGDGVDTRYFVPAAPSPEVRVLMMARLLRSKGVAEFVAAARLVRQHLPQVVFQLAGAPDAGNPESISEAEIAAWQAAGEVVFLGQRNDALALNQACTLAVLPSTQGEGVPRALLEAAACGKALVATDVPGCRELVLPEETGVLVPPGDAAALAQAIVRLLSDTSLSQRLGAAARKRVEACFSDDCVIAETLVVYACFDERK